MKLKKYFKKYESVFILEDKSIEKKKLEILELIREHGGVIDGVETWGIKRLAYPIKHKNKNGDYKDFESGYFFKVDLRVFSEVEKEIKSMVNSLRGFLRDYDGLLKYVFVWIEDGIEQRELTFEDELYSILDKYSESSVDWREEPLDVDDIDRLVKHLRNELNLINGNITNKEYEELEG